MRLKRIQYQFIWISIIAMLNILKGYCYEPGTWIGDLVYLKQWPQPEFFLIDLNPKVDNMIFWLINDLSFCYLIMMFCNELIRRSFTKKWQRAVCFAFHSYFSVEILTILLTQFCLKGESFNDQWLLIIVVALFLFRIRTTIWNLLIKLRKVLRLSNK